MKAFIFKSLFFATATAVSTPGAVLAQDFARTLFAVDISGSSTYLFDQSSANAAAGFVENYIGGLAVPHEVRMVSVGDTGLARRMIDIKAVLTDRKATSPVRMATEFGGYFRSLPNLHDKGQINEQDTTSLVAFFASLEPVCAKGNMTVVVFTDGVEWSSVVDGQALVDGKAHLPKPDHAYLTGCSVIMNGIGQLKGSLSSEGLEARLMPEWRSFLDAAGASPVSIAGAFFAF